MRDVIEETRALLGAARPGPWATEYEAQYLSGDVYMVHAVDGAEETLIARDVREADAALIAAAPRLLAAMAAELEAARAVAEAAEALDPEEDGPGLYRCTADHEQVQRYRRAMMDYSAAKAGKAVE